MGVKCPLIGSGCSPAGGYRGYQQGIADSGDCFHLLDGMRCRHVKV